MQAGLRQLRVYVHVTMLCCEAIECKSYADEAYRIPQIYLGLIIGIYAGLGLDFAIFFQIFLI